MLQALQKPSVALWLLSTFLVVWQASAKQL